MIEVDRLTKRYGIFTAVNALSFSAQAGEIVGFLGPNGAGKTTTMRILSGYMPPSEGTAKVAGFDVFLDSLEVRRRVGYLPETVPLYPDLTVGGYVQYLAELRGVPQAKARTTDVLKTVGMYERRGSLIRNISKGMRQRTGIAGALVHEPQVLILDEPTIGLDPRQTLEMRDIVRGLGKHHTILFSTHILSEAEQICDQVLIIDRGQLMAMDSPAALREKLQSGVRLLMRTSGGTGEEALRKLIKQVGGIGTIEITAQPGGVHEALISSQEGIDVRARLAAGIVAGGFSLLELRPVAISLEDIFLELTARQKNRNPL
jgi:ABC-2 type transport system ATP-binding protein